MTDKFAYPDTQREDVVDTYHGVAVADPYRWLENDVRTDPRVADWVAAENAVTDAYLATLPAREHFKARITELFDFERFGVPVKRGGRYFYLHNSGLQNQAVLYVRDSLDGEGRVARCHLRDASWFQWPLLETAIEGNIVADFPLCNKSFNCSYSGHDL